jgi:hypothetical protein
MWGKVHPSESIVPSQVDTSVFHTWKAAVAHMVSGPLFGAELTPSSRFTRTSSVPDGLKVGDLTTASKSRRRASKGGENIEDGVGGVETGVTVVLQGGENGETKEV